MINDVIGRITAVFSNFQLVDGLIAFLQKLTFAVVVFWGVIILGRLVIRTALPRLRHHKIGRASCRERVSSPV